MYFHAKGLNVWEVVSLTFLQQSYLISWLSSGAGGYIIPAVKGIQCMQTREECVVCVKTLHLSTLCHHMCNSRATIPAVLYGSRYLWSYKSSLFHFLELWLRGMCIERLHYTWDTGSRQLTSPTQKGGCLNTGNAPSERSDIYASSIRKALVNKFILLFKKQAKIPPIPCHQQKIIQGILKLYTFCWLCILKKVACEFRPDSLGISQYCVVYLRCTLGKLLNFPVPHFL